MDREFKSNMTMSDLNGYLNSERNGLLWDSLLCDRLNNPKCLEKYGFKVYSQNDEDGIIEEIFNRIGVTNKLFVEFGVQDGIESNGHYLLLKNWRGLWIECDEEYYQKILTGFESTIAAGNLAVIHEFITRDNINQVILDNMAEEEIDLLSIDIDGNDYHIWRAITVMSPRVVIIEYNAKIPPTCEWVMPYCEQHIWDGGDKHGASLLSLENLGKQKGYTLVGTNISGVNAFFVRNDCINNQFAVLEVNELYNPPRYYKRFFAGHPSLYCLKDIPQGRKQLFCGSKASFLFKSGFHLQEDASGITHWMAHKKAVLWIKDENHKHSGLFIKLENPMFSCGCASVPKMVKLSIEEDTILEHEFKQSTESVKIIFEKEKLKNDEVIVLTIETDSLWRPCDVGVGEDNRHLGLCVKAIEFI